MLTTQALIGDIIPPIQRGRYQGIFGAVLGVGSVAGPILGGYFTSNLTWRLIFYINLPLGILALVVLTSTLPAQDCYQRSAIDYLGAKASQERRRAAFPTEMKGYDAVVTLPAFGEAPRGLQSTGDAAYCAPWTFLGTPAVTLPAGFGPNGLPLGIQLVGRYREDLHLLRVAKWAEATLAFDPGIPGIMS